MDGGRTFADTPSRLGWLACALAVTVFAALASIRPVADPDLFWHLLTGDWIRAHAAIPTVDSFSHTFAGRPLHLVDWLADVLLSVVYGAGGLAAIHALAAGLAAALMLVTAARLRAARMPLALLVSGMVLVFAGAAARIYSRPQTFGLLLAAVEVWLLEGATDRPRPWRLLFCALPPLLCLWSNLHGSSPLGLALLGIFAVGDLWSRRREPGRAVAGRLARWGGLAVVSVGGLLLASNPIGRIEMGLALTGSQVFRTVISEWQPTTLHVLLGPVGGLAALVLAGLMLDARGVRAWEWLLVAFAAYLASTAWRFVPFFGLLAGPVGLRHLACALVRARPAASALAPTLDKACAGIVLATAFVVAFALDRPTPWLGAARRPADGLAANLFPVDGARFIANARPAGRMFNSFHWGGYLMWSVPGLPVFIDGRTETLYDEAFLKENTDLSPATWRGTFAKYRVDFAILLPSVLAEDIAVDPGWTTVYFDDACAVLVRLDGPNAQLAERLGYRYLTPDGLRPGTRPDDAADVLREASRAVAAAPGSGRAHVLLANALLATGDQAGYEREAARARDLAPDVASVWYRIGLRHLLAGTPGARGELERAVFLAPHSAQYREASAIACLIDRDPRAAERALASTPNGLPASERLRQLAESPLGMAARARAR